MATRVAFLACGLALHILVAESRRASGASRSQYYGNKGNVETVWQTAGKREGLNPSTHRVDASGKIIKRDGYGKYDAAGSWEIDHIKPRSKGGSDHVHNLQALNTHDNRAFGNTELKKPRRTEH